MSGTPRRGLRSGALLGALALAGCGPKVVVEPVFEDPAVRVVLRRTIEDGETVPLGYDHPAVIADVRLAHILASLNYETPKGKQSPTIRTMHVYPLAQGLAQAFAKAGPDDELAAAAFARDPRLGIFTDDKVTSFRAYMRDGQLFLEFYAVEQSLEDPGVVDESSKYKIPTRFPTRAPLFRFVTGRAIVLVGPRTLAVDWRSPEFRKPLTLTRSGIQRRTILMEEAEDVELDPKVGARPAGFTDAQLRALDQIDAARRSGLITELEFQRRRRLIVEGRLEEAGYPREE